MDELDEVKKKVSNSIELIAKRNENFIDLTPDQVYSLSAGKPDLVQDLIKTWAIIGIKVWNFSNVLDEQRV